MGFEQGHGIYEAYPANHCYGDLDHCDEPCGLILSSFDDQVWLQTLKKSISLDIFPRAVVVLLKKKRVVKELTHFKLGSKNYELQLVVDLFLNGINFDTY